MIAVKDYCTFLLGHDAVICAADDHITNMSYTRLHVQWFVSMH